MYFDRRHILVSKTKLKVKAWNKIHHANSNRQKAGVVILPEEVDSKIPMVTEARKDIL